MQRTCTKCRQRKPVEEFTAGRVCDPCRLESEVHRQAYLIAWRTANGARSSRKWRERNPEYEKERYRRGKEKSNG